MSHIRPSSSGLFLALVLLSTGCLAVPAAPSATAVPPTNSSAPSRTAAPTVTPFSIQTATPRLLLTATPIPLPVDTATPLAPGDPATPGPAPQTEPAPADTPVPATAAPLPPAILFFSGSPAEIDPGQPVALTWAAQGETVTVQRIDMLGRLGEWYNVPLSGTLTLSPPPAQRGAVQFMLFASTGEQWTSASFTALIRCPDTWFFANPPAACPASPPNTTVMQAQHFERGLMLWTQFNDRIIILYGDGRSPRWQFVQNAWFAGQPETDPAIFPPTGFYQPVRGFGVAWRTASSSGGSVRDRLGWGIDEEFGVPDAGFQCDSAPKYSQCYVSGSGGVVYVLGPEFSSWAEWRGR